MAKLVRLLIVSILFIIHVANVAISAEDLLGDNGLGPQSKQAIGQKKLLIVVVRFPDAAPSVPLERVRKRAVSAFNSYVVEQSYGQTSLNADFKGYVMLPDSLSRYKVSPFNNQVDSGAVRKLVEDTMTAVESEVDFASYDYMLIIPAVQTVVKAGSESSWNGYGMVCYCANPGMLTPIRKKDLFQTLGRVGQYETVRSKGGKEFSGGIFVGTENANLGMFAHDFFHALGGLYQGRRFAPCLYDYERQSNATQRWEDKDNAYKIISIYMGPWDIMSQHFINPGEPPPGISSFTKIRLGWIGREKIKTVKPGETSLAFLSPLSKGGDLLVVAIPAGEHRHYLIENRQPIGFDKVLPDSGLLILEVRRMPNDAHGPVRVKSAAMGDTFEKATYKLEAEGRNAFVDEENNIAVIPLWKEKDNLGLLVTTPNLKDQAIRAALAIKALVEKKPAASSKEAENLIESAIAAFRNNDFEKSYAIAVGR